MTGRYRAALVSIREDAREAHDALLGDDFRRVGELLDKIEADAIDGLGHVAFGPELVIPPCFDCPDPNGCHRVGFDRCDAAVREYNEYGDH